MSSVDAAAEFKYKLHKADDKTSVQNYCEADSIPELGAREWCGKMTMYFIKDDKHHEYYTCAAVRAELRSMGLLR